MIKLPKALDKYKYYEEKDIVLLHGDCLEILPLLEPDSVDLVLTSPPYDNLREYEGFTFDFEGVANGLSNCLSIGGIIVWVVGDATIDGSETGTSFKQALYFKDNCGLNLHDTMIYAKNSYMPLTHKRYEQAFEYMFIISKGKPKTFNPLLLACKHVASFRNRSNSKAKENTYAERKREEKTEVNKFRQHPNIFYYDVGKNDKTSHPAPFPKELAHDHVNSWSNSADLILDPFLGSGTTAVAAKQLGRKCIGIELEQKYLDIAVERLRQPCDEVLYSKNELKKKGMFF